MTKFYRADDAFFVFNQSKTENVVDRLPVGFYVIKQHPLSQEYYFAKYDKEVTVPEKIYGNSRARSKRIIQTFMDRPKSTGLLLSGEKGSGKTMLGNLVCKDLSLMGIPTIFITEPHTSQAFMELIGSITQPVVVFFDEFEKTYDGKNSEGFGHHDQKAILTLLDGVFSAKILYILTCNDRWSIDDHMINRPGRLFYSFEFEGLEKDFVEEYCSDNLNDKERIPEVLRIVPLFGRFNFDMLKALVEEMNRYDESAKDSLGYLNINPQRDSNEYSVKVIPLGMTTPIKVTPEKIANPLSWRDAMGFCSYELPSSYARARKGSNWDQSGMKPFNFSLAAAINVDDDDDEDGAYTAFNWEVADIKLSTDNGFELVNKHGEKLILTKEEPRLDWRSF